MIDINQSVHEYFSRFSVISFKKGEMILRAEDQPHGVYYIEKGVVRQYIINGSGETLMLQLYRAGSFIPMTWIVNDTPNRYFFEAASPVSIRRAPKADFERFLALAPEVYHDFTKRLLTGVSGLWLRIEQLVLECAYAKAVLLILYYAHTFGTETPEGILFDLSPTHREIASWIGTTRETASLQVEALKKKKLLRTRGRQFIIPSLSALERELARIRSDRAS